MPTALKENAKYLFVVSLLFSVLTLITFNIQTISAGKKVLGASTAVAKATEKEKGFWLTFLAANPNYFDGWAELAVLEYEQGSLDKANEYYLKARAIDPNSEKLPW